MIGILLKCIVAWNFICQTGGLGDERFVCLFLCLFNQEMYTESNRGGAKLIAGPPLLHATHTVSFGIRGVCFGGGCLMCI